MCRAAHALVAAQASPAQSSAWAWELGSRRVALNASGVVAAALVAVPSCGGLEAADRFARARLARHRALDILYDGDVEALALVGRAQNDPAMVATAREAFRRRYEGATGEEIVARWLMLRPGTLLGYDAAQAIRAGRAVGEEAKARQIALAVLAAAPRWRSGADEHGWAVTSRGALLEALAGLAPAEQFAAACRDLAHQLVLEQSRDGSWGVHNTQATAYAVRGLLRADESYALDAAQRGRSWLARTQLTQGAWGTFHDGLGEPFVGEVVPEVTAEVLLALAGPAERPVPP